MTAADLGPPNATTDPDTGQRRYVWMGRPLLSNTSLRKTIGLPFDLHQWIVAQNIDASIILGNEGGYPFASFGSNANESDIDLGGPTIDLDEFKALKKDAASADRKVSDKAKRKLTEYRRPIRALADVERDASADLGKRVHRAAETRTKVADAEEEVRPFLRQFYAAERTLRMELLYQEVQSFNLTLGYAGTIDAIGYVTHPETGERILAVLDWKTGKSLYIDNLMQLAGYALAEFIGRDDVIDQRATDTLHQAQAICVVHLRPEGWGFYDLRLSESVMQAFTHLCHLANFLDANERIDPFVISKYKGEAP